MTEDEHQVPAVSTRGQTKTAKDRNKLPVGLSKGYFTAPFTAVASHNRIGTLLESQVSGIYPVHRSFHPDKKFREIFIP